MKRHFSQLLGIVILCCWASTPVVSMLDYQTKIPNGNGVAGWPGVGHLDKSGGGNRNAFGNDFAAAGHSWTQDLCEKDSDGDGLTNGEELGDPDCIWEVGQTPSFPALSHPGISESTEEPTPTTCEDSEMPGNVNNMTIQFSPYTLPSGVVTSYPRQAFDLRNVPGSAGVGLFIRGLIIYTCTNISFQNVDHWAFRFETIYGGPINVVHHILLYSCTEDEVADYLAEPITTGGMPCSQGLVYGWAIGEFSMRMLTRVYL